MSVLYYVIMHLYIIILTRKNQFIPWGKRDPNIFLFGCVVQCLRTRDVRINYGHYRKKELRQYFRTV